MGNLGVHGFSSPSEKSSEVIYDKTVTAPTSRFFVPNIPQNGYEIEIKFLGQAAYVTNGAILVALNGDETSGNYHVTRHRGGTPHQMYDADGRQVAIIPGTSVVTEGITTPGMVNARIINPFTSAFTKYIYSVSVVRFATYTEIWQYGVHWENTSPIQSLLFTTNASENFSIGSRMIVKVNR